MIAANDITAVFLTIPLIFYLNKKHKAFWCGVGQLVAALANFLPFLTFLLIPTSYVEKTISDGANADFCVMNRDTETDSCDEAEQQTKDLGKIFALICFFICKLCAGVAQQTYWTIGLAYMDDNVR